MNRVGQEERGQHIMIRAWRLQKLNTEFRKKGGKELLKEIIAVLDQLIDALRQEQ